MEGSFGPVQVFAMVVVFFAVACFVGTVFGTIYWAVQRHKRTLMKNLSRRQPIEE